MDSAASLYRQIKAVQDRILVYYNEKYPIGLVLVARAAMDHTVSELFELIAELVAAGKTEEAKQELIDCLRGMEEMEKDLHEVDKQLDSQKTPVPETFPQPPARA